MVALLLYLALGKKNDVIRVLNGGKAVGNNEHRSDIHHFFKRILNEKLGFGIYIRRRLVEYHNGRLMNYRSCKREKLALTCGEIVSALADLFVNAVL